MDQQERDNIATDSANFINAIYGTRGRVMQQAIEIETIIDYYIVEYFTTDDTKVFELSSLIVSSTLTFRAKLQILLFLLEKNSGLTQTELKQLQNTLDGLVSHRNIFAHWMVDQSIAAQKRFKSDQTLIFMQFKQRKEGGKRVLGEKELYSEKRINDLVDVFFKTKEYLLKFLEPAPKSQS